jgi:DNA-binding NarL/FixJ family response regulator
VRVVVADDVLLTREGIVRLLRDANIEVVAEAQDAQGLLHHVRLARPDVAMVDIRMPPTHTDEGLVAAQTIRAEHPQVGVLVLSQYVEPSYAMRLIQEQPERVGYLLKERVFDIATVVDALRRIVDGETVIDPTIVSRLAGRATPPTGPPGRPQRAGTRGPRADRRGHVQPGHRRPAVRHRTHRGSPRHPDLPEAPPLRVARPAPPRACRPDLPPRLTRPSRPSVSTAREEPGLHRNACRRRTWTSG